MELLLIFALLATASCIANGVHSDWNDVVFAAPFALGSVGGYIYHILLERHTLRLERWLIENREAIAQGEAWYRGQRVGLDAELVRFDVCVSLLVITWRERSGFIMRHQDSWIAASFIYSGVTFLFGWWGLPWGPVRTVAALTRNIRGGERVTVGEMLTTHADTELRLRSNARMVPGRE